jgi:hypothetical protein
MRLARSMQESKGNLDHRFAILLLIGEHDVRPLLLGFRRRLPSVTEPALLHAISFTSGSRWRSRHRVPFRLRFMRPSSDEFLLQKPAWRVAFAVEVCSTLHTAKSLLSASV